MAIVDLARQRMGAIRKLSERFIEVAIDDEIVIMKLDSGEFFALSGTSAATWRLIDGNRDRAALLSALNDNFAGDDERMASDVDELLRRLSDIGLLVAS